MSEQPEKKESLHDVVDRLVSAVGRVNRGLLLDVANLPDSPESQAQLAVKLGNNGEKKVEAVVGLIKNASERTGKNYDTVRKAILIWMAN